MTAGSSAAADAPAPKWVQEMHEHFRQTGAYRAEDLDRVLGNTRECVEVQIADGLAINHHKK
jgi:hypothetical protein